jgi:hypothetical protein
MFLVALQPVSTSESSLFYWVGTSLEGASVWLTMLVTVLTKEW